MYDWVIKHRNGAKHTNTDLLSRRLTQSDTTPQPTSDLSISGKSEPPLVTAPLTTHAVIDLSQTLSVDIAQCQKDDVTLRTVSEWLKD